MFSRIQARHFRCLKAVDQRLGPVQALVGPNGSGKTTFLEGIGLLGDLIRARRDVRDVLHQRSAPFEKLVWQGPEQSPDASPAFQLAVEAPIPACVRRQMAEDKQGYQSVRYEIEIGLDAGRNELGLNHETLSLCKLVSEPVLAPRLPFPDVPRVAPTVFVKPLTRGYKVAVKKIPDGNDNYYTEGPKKYMPSFRLGRTRLALAHIPADEESFPVSTWFRGLLETGVQTIVLNSQTMRQPSPPGQGRRFQPDGSNLPWVIADLKREPERFESWLRHIRTALEDIQTIEVVERGEDRHCYLVVHYANGAQVPSWLVSDGTLRLLALTIPAYCRNVEGVLLIEEPENGIHPRAIETVIQSLTSLYEAQVLIATHSPVALNLLEPEQILCFARDDTGATDIVTGSRHPALQQWKRGEPDLGTLFAAGILS